MGGLAGVDWSRYPTTLGCCDSQPREAQRGGRERLGLGLQIMTGLAPQAGLGAGKGGPTRGQAAPNLFDPLLSQLWEGAKAVTSKFLQSAELEGETPSTELASCSFYCVSSLFFFF